MLNKKKIFVPWASSLLAILIAVVGIWQQHVGEDGFALLSIYGVVPIDFWAALLSAEVWWKSNELFRLVTAQFLHVDWPHLIGNLVFFYLFSQKVERVLGGVGFIGFCITAGAFANLIAAWQAPELTVAIVGCSGMTSALLGAFIGLYPTARIGVVVPLGLYLQLIRVPALMLIGLWFLLQLMYTFVIPEVVAVAWWTHIAGFLIGIIMIQPARLISPKRTKTYE